MDYEAPVGGDPESKVTHHCGRCRENRPLKEWYYIPRRHAWEHIRTFEVTDGAGHKVRLPCGWVDRIPTKV